MVIPYVQGLGESIKHISNKYGIQTYFKGNRTFKQLLVRTKNQRENKVVLYIVTNVEPLTVEKNTLERLQGPWGEWYKEHLKEPSPIQAHSQLTGHQPSPDNFNVLGMEVQDMTCLIKEYLHQGE